jgi:flagellar biosynthesis protein FlhB
MGVAVWWIWTTALEYRQDLRRSKWPCVECEIIKSTIEKEAGEDGEDLFVVRYKYEWAGEVLESEQYREGYDGDTLYYPAAEELTVHYQAGEKTSCFVNPLNPKEAVLEVGDLLFWTYMIIPGFMLIVGGGQLYSGYRLFFKGKENKRIVDLNELGTWQRRVRIFWKWSTRIATCMAICLAFWAVFFVFVFFMVFPYLFVHAMGKAFKDAKKELVKIQPAETPSGADYSKKGTKLHLTRTEKVIIALGVAGFVFAEVLWLRHFFGSQGDNSKDLISVFGILFTACWTFGLASILTYGIIAARREFLKDRWRKAHMSKEEKIAESICKKDLRYFLRDTSMWTLLASNMIINIWAVFEKWPLSMIMCVYWFQSVIIGIFWSVKIFRLREFSTKDFHLNNLPLKPTAATNIRIGVFFLLHYNFFHFVYAIFLIKILGARPSGVVPLAAGIFFLNQVFSFWHNREEDEGKKPNLGKIMSYPYARIIPMHITVIVAGILQDKEITIEGTLMLVLFLALKTVADVGMYVVQRRGFEDKPKTADTNSLEDWR